MRVELYDGNNVFQRYLANDVSGMPLRTLLNVLNSPTKHFKPMVVWDGKGSITSRRDILPSYKAQRESKGEDFLAAMRLLKQALAYTNVVQIEVPGYEADDVIASLVSQPDLEVQHIYTTDEDLAAFGVPTDGKEPSVEPHWMRLYKATVGDPADNVKGIKGLGKNTFAKFTDDECAALEQMFSTGAVPDFLPKSCKNWLSDDDNFSEALKNWKVVGFYDVSEETILDNMTIGKFDPDTVEQILTPYEV